MIFCGLQASGKTTFYRSRFRDSHTHVSKDLMPNNRRKEARNGRAKVPRVGTFATAKRLEAPTPAEGYDELFNRRACGVPIPPVSLHA